MWRAMLLGGLLAASAASADASPQAYRLDAARSIVGFGWQFGPGRVQGRMPILGADLVLDFQRLAGSRIKVVMDATRIEAGFPFATQAIRGPKMLDAARFGQIRFLSRSVVAEQGGARVKGDLTMRGVTRSVVLHARFHGPVGADPAKLRHLRVRLTGRLNRSDFGASGWGGMVADAIDLSILAALDFAP